MASSSALLSTTCPSVCVDVFGIGLRFPSVRGKVGERKEAKRNKKKAQEPLKEEKKTLTLPAHLEAMYAKPKKGSTTTTLAALTSTLPPMMLQGHGKARCHTPNSPENSYMSVAVSCGHRVNKILFESYSRAEAGKGKEIS